MTTTTMLLVDLGPTPSGLQFSTRLIHSRWQIRERERESNRTENQPDSVKFKTGLMQFGLEPGSSQTKSDPKLCSGLLRMVEQTGVRENKMAGACSLFVSLTLDS